MRGFRHLYTATLKRADLRQLAALCTSGLALPVGCEIGARGPPAPSDGGCGPQAPNGRGLRVGRGCHEPPPTGACGPQAPNAA